MSEQVHTHCSRWVQLDLRQLDMYVQNISPLTALFADTPGQLEGDLGPALGAEAMH